MTAAYGSVARIGLILPADNVVIEPELAELGIEGVSFHGLRLTALEHNDMRSQAVELSKALVEMGVDAAVYACAETSFNGGDNMRQTLSEVISERCGVPVVTATNATLEAVRAMGLTAVTAVTPYTESSAALFERTLSIAGAEVVGAAHHDFGHDGPDAREWFYTNRQSVQTAMTMALQADTKESEGTVIGSTNWPTLEKLEELETLTGKPVITSNQSIIWWCANHLGFSLRAVRSGELFRTSPVVAAQ